MHFCASFARLARCQRRPLVSVQLYSTYHSFPLLSRLPWDTTTKRHFKHTLVQTHEHVRRYGSNTQLPQLVSACTIQGRRPYQEDRYTVSHLTPEVSFIACYDGHGGAECAEFAHNTLHKYFRELVQTNEEWESALQRSFKRLDDEFVATGDRSGTTAVVAILGEDRLVVANVGDSKAILCNAGKPVLVTKDHKPNDDEEHRRIVDCGGDVVADSDGTSRVNARLAMSRSIGDAEFKQYGVIAEPNIVSRELSDRDCFLVLMTDGVSDVLNDAQVCAVVNSSNDPEEACQELVSLAAQLGSMDNITALVIRLAGWGKFDNPEDVRLRQQAYTYSRGGRFRPLAFT